MKSILLVFLGGGLGTICRFGLAKYFNPDTLHGFPWGTFLANTIACCLLGYFVAQLAKPELNAFYPLLLMTGFCGGFSTFSTFALENYNLFSTGNYGTALLYTGVSMILGLGAVFIGIKIGHL